MPGASDSVFRLCSRRLSTASRRQDTRPFARPSHHRDDQPYLVYLHNYNLCGSAPAGRPRTAGPPPATGPSCSTSRRYENNCHQCSPRSTGRAGAAARPVEGVLPLIFSALPHPMFPMISVSLPLKVESSATACTATPALPACHTPTPALPATLWHCSTFLIRSACFAAFP